MRLWLTCLLLAAAAGCGVPEPPEPVNAETWGHTPHVPLDPVAIHTDRVSQWSVLRTGKPTIQEYARQDQGDWDQVWWELTLPVEEVLEGQWADDHVRFIVSESWPKPETGIMVNRQPWPWNMGQQFVLRIDSAFGNSPLIRAVAPQRRPGTVWRHGVTEPPLATEP